jgi:hypothetical protein
MFKNQEMEIIYNRSTAILESLSNLGKYIVGTKLYVRMIIQKELDKKISKEEYADALIGMRFLKTINPRMLKNPIYDEYKDALIKKIKSRRWLRRTLRNIWKSLKTLCRKS